MNRLYLLAICIVTIVISASLSAQPISWHDPYKVSVAIEGGIARLYNEDGRVVYAGQPEDVPSLCWAIARARTTGNNVGVRIHNDRYIITDGWREPGPYIVDPSLIDEVVYATGLREYWLLNNRNRELLLYATRTTDDNFVQTYARARAHEQNEMAGLMVLTGAIFPGFRWGARDPHEWVATTRFTTAHFFARDAFTFFHRGMGGVYHVDDDAPFSAATRARLRQIFEQIPDFFHGEIVLLSGDQWPVFGHILAFALGGARQNHWPHLDNAIEARVDFDNEAATQIQVHERVFSGYFPGSPSL